MTATSTYYRTLAPQHDLFQGALDCALSKGFGVRNPELIARGKRQVANAEDLRETLRLAHDDTLRSVVLHSKLQNPARKLKRG